MRKVAFYTLGCKVNQYETEAMKGLFEQHGDKIVEAHDQADVYVINTCTVTQVGDKKSRQFIRKCKRTNPHAVVAVVGCYAQIAPEEVSALEGVNLILGTDDRSKIVNYLEDLTATDKICAVGDIMATHTFEELQIDSVKDKTRVFLKIQEGCNQYCSYCIIPYARGNIRSRLLENIVSEVKRVVANGFVEVVLTGIHLASYGKDLVSTGLIDVIEALQTIEGLKRIRLGSLEPMVVTPEFMRRLSQLDKVCDQFHLSLQTGHDDVLRAMNRRYTQAEYLESVRLIREVYPLAALTTDVIVGFPGETDEQFQETCRFCEAIGFSEMHVFKYSKRKGTVAYAMPNQVDEAIKQDRSDQLIHLATKMQEAYLDRLIGTTTSVLIEKVDACSTNGRGLTPHHVMVRVNGPLLEERTLVHVRLMKRDGHVLVGKVCGI